MENKPKVKIRPVDEISNFVHDGIDYTAIPIKYQKQLSGTAMPIPSGRKVLIVKSDEIEIER